LTIIVKIDNIIQKLTLTSVTQGSKDNNR